MPATYTVGDGKTYSTIQAAIDAIPGDLSGLGIQTVEVYTKAAGYMEAIDARAGFSNQSAANYIHIKAMVAHNGQRGGGIVIDCGSVVVADQIILGKYTRFSGFCITSSTRKSASDVRIIAAEDGFGEGVHIYNNIIYDCDADDNRILNAIDIGNINARVYNNVIANIGSLSTADGRGILISQSATNGNVSVCANNTILGTSIYCLFNLQKNYWKIENNYCGDDSNQDIFSNTAGTGGTFNYNISSDASAGGAGNNLSNKASINQFIDNDPADFDVHLLESADCNRIGQDESGYYTTDFEGDTRSSWNTGADELITSPAGLCGSCAMMAPVL